MRANKKRISFDLSIDQFNTIISQICVYCGRADRIGIDRKDNKEGYTLNNTQPCCDMCNHMKFIYTESEFINQVERIHIYQESINAI